jgi:zinc protease
MKRSTFAATALALLTVACGSTPTPTTVTGPIDRSGLPQPGARTDWAPPAVQTWTMANGLDVWLVEQKQAPLIALELVLPQGAATDPPAKAGLAALTVDLLDEGAGDRDALTLSEAFQRIATDYSGGAGTAGITFSLSMLADQLDPSLALLSDILLRPRMPEAEFNRRKAQRLAHALASEAQPRAASSVLVRRALFGDGFAGRPSGGVRSTLDSITYADVKARYSALIKPQGGLVIAVGAVDRATLEPALNKALSTWSGTPSLSNAPMSAKAGQRAIYFVDFPGATQSSISVGRRIPGTKATDYFAAKVFNWALGGAFTSRLNLNLREDKGYTYGARAHLLRWVEGGAYLLGASVKADTTRKSIDEIIKELTAMGGPKPLTEDERGQAIGGMLLGFPGRFERMSSVAGQLSTVRLDGFDPVWFRSWPKRLSEVTLAQARASALALIDPANYLIVIAGDYAKVAPTLDGLELPILRFDAQGNPLPETPADAKPAAKAP